MTKWFLKTGILPVTLSTYHVLKSYDPEIIGGGLKLWNRSFEVLISWPLVGQPGYGSSPVWLARLFCFLVTVTGLLQWKWSLFTGSWNVGRSGSKVITLCRQCFTPEHLCHDDLNQSLGH